MLGNFLLDGCVHPQEEICSVTANYKYFWENVVVEGQAGQQKHRTLEILVRQETQFLSFYSVVACFAFDFLFGCVFFELWRAMAKTHEHKFFFFLAYIPTTNQVMTAS